VGADQEHREVAVDLGRVAADRAFGRRFGPGTADAPAWTKVDARFRPGQ
jgi:hypothetical protein